MSLRCRLFNAHLKKLAAFLSSKLRIIRVIAHTSWGWHHSTLKMAYHTLIYSKLNYALPTCQPGLSATNLSCLDCLQNRSLLNHYWPACVYSIGSLMLGSSCSELPHMQLPINPESSRKGIAQHRRSSKMYCFGC